MSAITVDGDLVHYEVLGRGRAVVLVHGWVGSWRYWIPTMQKLHLKFRVYAVDLFGFGDSARATKKYTIDHQVYLLSEFMNQLGLKKAALVGHGLGGLVLTEFARRHHDQIARMMLVSPPLFDPGGLASRVPPGQQILLTPPPSVGSSQASLRPIDKTLPSRTTAADVMAAADATIVNDRLLSRSRLREAYLAAGLDPQAGPRATPQVNATDNPLYRALGSMNPEMLLQRAFKKSESHYERLAPDVTKTDPIVIERSAHNYDAGAMLDILRALQMPIVMVHGKDDQIVQEPTEDILNYLSAEKEDQLLSMTLPNVRHFPMLESDEFFQIMSGFLEQQEIKNIATKTRWRRRSR